MNEAAEQPDAQTPAGGESARQPSAGEMLRQAREDAGLHIAALAVALKVSVKKLEALEADQLDLLPDIVFVRAMASGVCRVLKIDPTPVLQRLPQSAAPRLQFDGIGRGLNTPFQTPGDASRVSIWDQFSKPVVLAALTLLVGALVLIFFPSMEHADAPDAPAATPATTPGLGAPVAAPAAPATPAVAVAAAPAERTAPARAPASPATPAKPAPAPVTTAPVTTAPPPVPAGASVAGAAVKPKLSSTGIIVFRTRGDSWIEVTDASGAIQVSRMVGDGEVVGVSGPLPLSAVVGRADITEVQVRGKPFPLDAVSKGNVARFEVK